MGEKTNKMWSVVTLGVTVGALITAAAIVMTVDPFFHYHKPLPLLQYPLDNERYINDGIIKHYDYDSVITGTSMTQNFKATEFDELWGANAIKIPFSGAFYKEINENIRQVLNYKPKVKQILRGLDRNAIFLDKDDMRYEESYYPRYLYDSYWLNDVKYCLNKKVLFENVRNVLKYTQNGGKTTTFDEYGNWNARYTFGKEAVLESYTRPETAGEKTALSPEEREVIKLNIEQNVTSLPSQYPDVTFYYFLTPYSICYWDSLVRSGELSRAMETERIAIEMILEVENIELYSFEDCFDLICNLDNYKDIAHYSEQVNSQILQWIHKGEHRLTKENCEDYLKRVETFYRNYPYDEIFAEN